MTFLPIVERELRVAARKKGTHWLWFAAAASAIGIFFVLLFGTDGSSRMRQLGSSIFLFVSVLGFALTLFAGVFLTSDCLCSERRDGTLGLLFLTDLRGYDVVLGKLVATSMVSAYALLAIVPVLGLPLMMGGVSGAEFARMVLALLVTLFFSLALGMFASAVSRDTRAAMLLSFGVMLALTGVLDLVAALVAWILESSDSFWLLLPSPLLGFVCAFDAWHQVGDGAAQYWTSILSMTGLGIALLSIASVRLPHSWQENNAVQATAANDVRTVSSEFGESVEQSPYGWLTNRDGFPGKWTCVFLGLLFIVWMVFFLGTLRSSFGSIPTFFITSFLIAYGLHVFGKVLMALQATRRLCEDRNSGALELLLVTPLTPEEIIGGQWQTLRRQFNPLLWALSIVNLALMLMALVARPSNMRTDEAWTFSAFFLGGIVLLWVDFNAISWFGMSTALRGVRSHRAVLNTMARILGPPWLAIFFFFALTISGGGISFRTMWLCWGAWIVLSIISAQVAAANRKRELLEDFRLLAVGDRPAKDLDPLQPRSPEWEVPPAETQTTPPPVLNSNSLR